MEDKDQKYLNFPIQLLEGFMLDTKKSLNDILYYSLYAHAQKLEHNEEISRFRSAANFYNVELNGNIQFKLDRGESIFQSTHPKSPKVGINLKTYWDYYENHKSEFEKICLLGFLAIKSILGNKPYCKITNNYWLSRMDGNSHSIAEVDELSDEIGKYLNEYQTKKIKGELSDKWGLVTYSRHTRGFYVSFKLSLDDLAYQAELKRKSTRDKMAKFEKNRAVEKAMDRIQKLIDGE